MKTRRITWPIESRGAARGRTERSAVLVAVERDGIVGLGEAAPLPGVSRETIDDVERELVAGAPRSPSARFAFETAQLDLEACARGVSIADLLGGAATSVPLAAVVDSVAEARAAWELGIRTLKLKLRADELALAHDVAAALPNARLRIDANRSWPRDRVRALLASLPAVEYVEEPCQDTVALLGERSRVPLAVDESLADAPAALAAPVVVLKPTLLGGLRRCLAIAREARCAIVTHALEGPIGTAACAELALALGGDRAAGLAPHPALTAPVPQLRASRVARAPHPGLGFSPDERAALWGASD